MSRPVDVIGADAVAALRAAGWIVVREDAIRLAQAMAREEARQAHNHGINPALDFAFGCRSA